MDDENFTAHMMIGALTSIISWEGRRRVTAALHAQGFDDYRASYDDVFRFLRADGSRVTELAELAQVTRQSMSEMIIELERRGYVERTPDPTDRRAVLIHRTARGWRVNEVARQVVQEAQQTWGALIGEEEYARMLASLRRIVASIELPAAGTASLRSIRQRQSNRMREMAPDTARHEEEET
jgi:DNA-binding MarR family transcriptional regulator